ncbi:MAG: hypothetical protein AAFQ90_10060 [Pseudomonadota bacterium]
MIRATILTLLVGLTLGGCTTMGTNVSGAFRCEAPDGICAPSTVIDDSAIASIEATSSTELLSPAGPYEIDEGGAPARQPVRQLQNVQVATNATTVAAPEEADPKSFELSVVFPSYVDARGRVIERRMIQTRVVLPGRGDAVDELARRAARQRGGGGLLALAESAPPLVALAPEPEGVTVATSEESTARPSDPIKAIKGEVRTLLAASDQRAGPPLGDAPTPTAFATPEPASSTPEPVPLPIVSADGFPGLAPGPEGEE